MRKRDRDREEDDGLLAGMTPRLTDLADPKKRKQVMKVARMMGFEVRREQLVRIGIAAAVLLVVLLIGLWAIAKALGLLFWGVLVVGAAAVAVKLFGSRPAAETRRVAPNTPRQVESEDSALRAWNADAERKADQALEELERKLKG